MNIYTLSGLECKDDAVALGLAALRKLAESKLARKSQGGGGVY